MPTTQTTNTTCASTAELRSKLAEAQTRQQILSATRAEYAFGAVVEKDKASIKKVDEITEELNRVANEIAVLTAALAESGRRDEAAAAAKRDSDECGNAEKALALLDSFEKRGAALDAAFDTAISEYNALVDEFRRLDALGFAPTTYNLVNSNMRLALKSKVMNTGLVVEHLRSHLRRNFVDVISGWSNHVRARATARLNKTAAKAA
jgi:hypothetical protein